jgi:archaetidylinositol phosphate synthase
MRVQGLSPNLLSWVSVTLAALTGILLFLSGRISGALALLAALIALSMSSLFDALDGKVARIRGVASKRGDFLDHVLDRYADIFIITGVFFSVYAREWVALFALLGILLTSYMGTQAQAVGVGRIYGGALGRADRLVILLLVIALHLFLDPDATLLFGYGGLRFTIMEYALLLFGVLGNLTAVQRALATWRRL